MSWFTTLALATLYLQVAGAITDGGVSGSFEKTVDLTSGASRMTEISGAMQSTTGFNGSYPWLFENGIAVRVDLPWKVSEARALAFVDRLGWLSAPARVTRFTESNSDAIQIARDTSGLPAIVTISDDNGPLTIHLSDWRRVGSITYPFSQTAIDSVGEITSLHARSVSLTKRISQGAFDIPRSIPHGALPGSAVVPITFAGRRDWHFTIMAKVDGHDTSLTFDTGGANYFGYEAAKRWGLRVSGGVNINGPGEGSISGGFAPVKSIAIGTATLRNETVVVAPLPWPPGPDTPNGLTGFEFLAEFRTTIDYPAKTLQFSSFASPLTERGAKLPFYSDGHTVYVVASVNDIPGIFRIDTGDSGAITLFKTFASAHHILSKDSFKHSGSGVGGRVPLKAARISKFTFGPSTLRNVPAVVSQTSKGAFASRTLAGNLGAKLFRCYRLTFDYQLRVLIVTDNGRSTATCLTSSN